jgi:hypothetical protein
MPHRGVWAVEQYISAMRAPILEVLLALLVFLLLEKDPLGHHLRAALGTRVQL